MMTGQPPPDYFRAVERTFMELRGGGMFLAPGDWDLVRRWEEQGIPLEIVRAGIREALSGRTRISLRMSLGECSAAVEAAFEATRRRAGAAGGWPEAESDSRRPERVAACLREWTPVAEALSDPETAPELRAAARLAAERLERLGKQPDPASVEDTLRDIEDQLLARLQVALADSVREDLEAEARRALEPYRARMPASTWRDACRRAVRRRVGRVFGLDSIGLSE